MKRWNLLLNKKKRNRQKFRNGFVFKSADSLIIEKCTEFENKLDETYEYLDSFEIARPSLDEIFVQVVREDTQ